MRQAQLTERRGDPTGAGRRARGPDRSWTTRKTRWTPRGPARDRGRQKTRRRDGLDKSRKQRHRKAVDRTMWRSLGKAYVYHRSLKGWKNRTEQKSSRSSGAEGVVEGTDQSGSAILLFSLYRREMVAMGPTKNSGSLSC